MVPTDESEQRFYFGSAPRPWEILIGWLLGLFALPFLILTFAILHRFILRSGWSRIPLFQRLDDLSWAAGSLILGLLLASLAFQLVTGRSLRQDGGLFSPGALRTWGMILALLPFVLLVLHALV